MLLRNVCIINNLQSVNLTLFGGITLISGFICLDVIADIEFITPFMISRLKQTVTHSP